MKGLNKITLGHASTASKNGRIPIKPHASKCVINWYRKPLAGKNSSPLELLLCFGMVFGYRKISLEKAFLSEDMK